MSLIPVGITKEAKKIQKACLQIQLPFSVNQSLAGNDLIFPLQTSEWSLRMGVTDGGRGGVGWGGLGRGENERGREAGTRGDSGTLAEASRGQVPLPTCWATAQTLWWPCVLSAN